MLRDALKAKSVAGAEVSRARRAVGAKWLVTLSCGQATIQPGAWSKMRSPAADEHGLAPMVQQIVKTGLARQSRQQ